jgi:hypothetical protein
LDSFTPEAATFLDILRILPAGKAYLNKKISPQLRAPTLADALYLNCVPLPHSTINRIDHQRLNICVMSLQLVELTTIRDELNIGHCYHDLEIPLESDLNGFIFCLISKISGIIPY